jgi:hypothetical protein
MAIGSNALVLLLQQADSNPLKQHGMTKPQKPQAKQQQLVFKGCEDYQAGQQPAA